MSKKQKNHKKNIKFDSEDENKYKDLFSKISNKILIKQKEEEKFIIY